MRTIPKVLTTPETRFGLEPALLYSEALLGIFVLLVLGASGKMLYGLGFIVVAHFTLLDLSAKEPRAVLLMVRSLRYRAFYRAASSPWL